MPVRRRAFTCVGTLVLAVAAASSVAQQNTAGASDAAPAIASQGASTPATHIPALDDVQVYVTTRPDSLTVGDRATLEVVVEAPAGIEVHFPPTNPIVERTIGVYGVEVQPPSADAAGTGRNTWIARYTIGVYAVGEVVLPPWLVQVRADSLVAFAHSDSVRFFVESVLDDSLAAADIRDLKPQQDVPVPLAWWVWASMAALAVLVALGILHRRRRTPAAVPLPPPRPAHDVALGELRKLETLRLPFDGKIKQHYMRLSEILRTYLENAPAFRISALEETTREILQELTSRSFRQEIVDELAAICEDADLVKFAKHQPAIDQCTAALERTRRFVLDTAKTSAQLVLQPQPEPIGAGAGADAAPAPDVLRTRGGAMPGWSRPPTPQAGTASGSAAGNGRGGDDPRREGPHEEDRS